MQIACMFLPQSMILFICQGRGGLVARAHANISTWVRNSVSCDLEFEHILGIYNYSLMWIIYTCKRIIRKMFIKYWHLFTVCSILSMCEKSNGSTEMYYYSRNCIMEL